MRPLKNGVNLIGKRTFSGLPASFNIEKMLICNLVLDASLFDRLILGRTQVVNSSKAI